ncbi:hypothetical protein AcV7_009768 [Taiwanofungus camphoratus]|nr:hypothetical protein AcV7_009768 [Antrodia cinnamomea]
MDERETTRKDPPARFALVTPSASPPASRSFFPPLRLPDRAPSAKRSRLASTPSSLSISTPTSGTFEPPNDIDEDRRAASSRLINLWSQLDRGVLRGSLKKFDMGCFAGDEPLSDVNDVGSDAGDAITDDDVDELDAFAPEANISDELEMEKEKLHIPPVQEMNPADAEDLREFLEAEQRRKELYGEEEDDDEAVGLRSLDHTDDLRTLRGKFGRSGELDEDSDEGDAETPITHEDEHDEDEKDDNDIIDVMTFQTKSTHVPLDDESEDELATWDIDDDAPVHSRVPRSDPADDIIDLTESPPSSATALRRGRSMGPPREPIGRPSQPQFKHELRARSKTPARKNTIVPSVPVSPHLSPLILQLCTPPQSSSSIVEDIPDITQVLDDVSSPSPSPPPRPRPRPIPRYKGAERSARLGEAAGSYAETASPVPHLDVVQFTAAPKSKPIKKDSKPSMIAEVVITREAKAASSARGSKGGFPFSSDTQAKESDDQNLEDLPSSNAPKATGKRKGKGKGKGKEVIRPTVHLSSHATAEDDPQSDSVVSKVTSKVKTQKPERHSQDSVPPLVRNRKRKRVISSSPLSDQSINNEVKRNTPPVLPRRCDEDGEQSPPSPGDKSDEFSKHDNRSRSPRRSRTPYTYASNQHASMYSPYVPYTHHDHQAEYPHPNAAVQDPQAQLQIAQTIHHLAYLLNSAGLPLNQGFPPAYPPPFPHYSPNWPPFTPTHKHQRSGRHQQFDAPSSEAGPSRSSSVYATPTHPHPYPYSFDPSFSGATLPPSSPAGSSEPSSPVQRQRSITRGRSKSRGRRVSFKLDDNDRPLPPTPHKHHEDADLSRAEDSEGSHVKQGGHAGRSEPSTSRLRGRSKSGDAICRTATKSVHAAASKGKARADFAGDDSAESTGAEDRHDGRGKRFERGRTPGPPSQRERSMLAHGRHKVHSRASIGTEK